MKDENMKLKLLQRTQCIYSCRHMTEDKKKVFNFGVQSSVKFEFCKQEQGLERDTIDSRYLFLWKANTIIKLVQMIILVKRE
jgi:hypothetical protein